MFNLFKKLCPRGGGHYPMPPPKCAPAKHCQAVIISDNSLTDEMADGARPLRTYCYCV